MALALDTSAVMANSKDRQKFREMPELFAV